ncbi:MAG: LysM peptidoglycan-binding domain-containing protein [Verrucomicrobiales bacterium]
MRKLTATLRARASWFLPVLAATLMSCTSPSQKMDLAPELIATPSHRMSRSEYPFDASGRYIDAWAAEGAIRHGRFINTDRTEDGRTDDDPPERRPLPPPPTASTTTSKPPASGSRTPPRSAASKPPATKPSASKPTTTKSNASKPPAKKPAASKRSTSHTVKRGDSLSTLSRRYGVSVQAIKKANNLKSDRIIDGRKLVIPK